jgi:hypothetical protein
LVLAEISEFKISVSPGFCSVSFFGLYSCRSDKKRSSSEIFELEKTFPSVFKKPLKQK